MTNFEMICSTKKFQADLEVSEVTDRGNLEAWKVLITYVTNRGKTRVMLHIGAGHSNNCQVKLKLFGYDRFCNNLQHKKFQANLVVSEVLMTCPYL